MIILLSGPHSYFGYLGINVCYNMYEQLVLQHELTFCSYIQITHYFDLLFFLPLTLTVVVAKRKSLQCGDLKNIIEQLSD